MLILVLTLIALATAVLSGMTGLGGGTVLIAALYALGFVPTVAVPLHAAVQMVSNGTRTLAYLPHVSWSGIGLFLVTAVPAAFIVAPLVAQANADWIRLFMAGFLLLVMWPRSLARIGLEGAAGLLVAGAISGGLGAVIGATGLLVAPFFLREHWSKETVIATMAVCQTAAHGTKIVAFSAYGYGLLAHWHWLLPMLLAVIVGTLIGRRLVGVFNERTFRWAFRGLLALLALRLAWDGLAGLLQASA